MRVWFASVCLLLASGCWFFAQPDKEPVQVVASQELLPRAISSQTFSEDWSTAPTAIRVNEPNGNPDDSDFGRLVWDAANISEDVDVLYAMAQPSQLGAITSVTFHLRARAPGYDIDEEGGNARYRFLVYDGVTASQTALVISDFLTGDWVAAELELTTNPITSASWTWNDLETYKLGFRARNLETDDIGADTDLSQFSAVVVSVRDDWLGGTDPSGFEFFKSADEALASHLSTATPPVASAWDRQQAEVAAAKVRTHNARPVPVTDDSESNFPLVHIWSGGTGYEVARTESYYHITPSTRILVWDVGDGAEKTVYALASAIASLLHQTHEDTSGTDWATFFANWGLVRVTGPRMTQFAGWLEQAELTVEWGHVEKKVIT